MKLLIEGCSYLPEDVKGVLPNDTLWTPGERIRIENVGYFHSPKCRDFVFFLPKVLLEPRMIDGVETDRVFCTAGNPDGFAPEEIIDPERPVAVGGRVLDEAQKSFLYEFSVWIYRAIMRFDETHPDSGVIYRRSEANSGSFRRRYVTNTLLDVILALRRFARDNRDYFLFKVKERHAGASRINWTRTISKSSAAVRDGRPLYLDPRSKKRMIDFDEELLVLFYSILNHIRVTFGFRVEIGAGYDLVTGERFARYLAGYGCARLRQIKYKYFSDRDLALWELCFAFFDRAHRANVVNDREEYLLAKDFNVVFESMIDDLIGDGEVAAFKELRDGKEIDHLYLDESLTTRGGADGRTFYIADSKYYKLGNALGEESVAKQFTYARNMLQLDLDLFLGGSSASDRVKKRRRPFEGVGLLRDDATEGYDIIPNFFISATLDGGYSYDEPGLRLHDDGNGGEYRNAHFENRLFDRDTLLLSHYDVNFLYVVKLYAQNDNGLKKSWREKVRREFRSRIRGILGDRFRFYAMMPRVGTAEGERFLRDHFRKTLGKVYSPYEPVDGKAVYSLALECPERMPDDTALSPEGLAAKKARIEAENGEVMALLKRAFHIVPCALGEDPTAALRAEAAAHPATGGAGGTDGVQIVAKVTGPLTEAVKASGWCPCPKEQCADPDAVRLLVTPFTQGAHLYRVIQEEGRRELDTPAALDELANEAFKAVKFPSFPLYAWRVEKL